MIRENRLALSTQTWAVLAPVLIIGLFTIGTNLMADGIAQLNQRGRATHERTCTRSPTRCARPAASRSRTSASC